MIVLDLVPGANAAGGAAVGLLAIGIVAHDGLVVALGLAVSLLTAALLIGFL